MAQNRYVSTITVYTYGDSPKEGLENAQKLANNINNEFDGSSASIESFYKKDFGAGCAVEIDMNEIKKS